MQNNKRIKKVSFINFNDNKGGAACVAWDIGKELRSKGIKTNYLVRNKYSNNEFVKEFPKLKVTKLLNRFTFGKDSQLIIDLFNSFLKSNDVSIGFSYKDIYKSIINSDLVHIHNIHGFGYFDLNTLIELSKRKRVVWTLHDMWAFTGHCVHSFQCERWKYGCASCPRLRVQEPILMDKTKKLFDIKNNIYKKSRFTVVVPSKWLLEKVNKSILGNQNIRLIHNGIDTSIFKRMDRYKCRKRLGLPINKKIAIFVSDGGLKNPLKGGESIESIADFYKDRDDILFVSIGGEKQKKLTGNLLKIPYIKDKKTLAEYYSSSEYFIFNSKAETFGLVITEAMACGCLVISSNVGIVSEVIIHKKNGYIIKNNDFKSILAGLNYFFKKNQIDINKIMKFNASLIKNEYSLGKMANGYLKLYIELTKQ